MQRECAHLPVLPAGEVEEDSLEARRQARRVPHGQAEPGGLLHELGEHAFGTRGVHADVFAVPLDRADSVEALGPLGERRGIAVHGHGDQRLGTVPALQFGRRVDGERLAVVDDRDALAEASASSM